MASQDLNKAMIIPVILAGGVGSRLWPLSRDLYPKQLLALTGEHSLLQATVTRILQLVTHSHIIIVCSQQYEFLVEEQLESLKKQYQLTFELIFEPVGRNTAPALALASLSAKKFGNPLLLVLPADHVIGNSELFVEQVKALALCLDEKMLTFGVKPHYPETGYGYIQIDPTSLQHTAFFPIQCFVEKPNLKEANLYCKKKNYYWNSGIFLYKASVYLKQLETYMPQVVSICQTAWSAAISPPDKDSKYLDEAIYSQCPAISIDYAIMEKTCIAVMAILNTTWNDVGSWQAVSEMDHADQQGNVYLGDVVALDTYNCYIRSESRLIAAVGLQNKIVVETSDAILILDKSKAQAVKTLVDQLKTQQRKEAESHSILYQPWGHYEILCSGLGFSVKQLTIKPSSRLSAIAQACTCEHWVVLRGVAHVQINAIPSILSVNQFVDILPLMPYTIDNQLDTPLKLLNIQTVGKSA